MADAAPDQVVATNDPGDETARRYSYQYAYTAVIACGCLDDTSGVEEVFCEHHEDLLVRYATNTFRGIQVKTRQPAGDPWKATDEDMLNAVARFAKLDQQFPGQFAHFTIATNHFFLSGKKTGSDLPYLLQLAADATDIGSADSKLCKYLRKVASFAGCSVDVVLVALKKTCVDDTLPKLDDIEQLLQSTVASAYSPAADTTLPMLRGAAEALVSEVHRASSLQHLQSVPRYLAVAANADAVAQDRIIDGKTLNRERIEAVLHAAINTPCLLQPGDTPPPQARPTAGTRLERKLEAGGLSVVSINAAKDLESAALHQYLEWQAKLGTDRAYKRYSHIKTLVLADSAGAYEAVKDDVTPFGAQMLTNLKSRFVARRTNGGAPLFDCLDEHLEGYAYLLTRACVVWWSQPFTIDEA